MRLTVLSSEAHRCLNAAHDLPYGPNKCHSMCCHRIRRLCHPLWMCLWDIAPTVAITGHRLVSHRFHVFLSWMLRLLLVPLTPISHPPNCWIYDLKVYTVYFTAHKIHNGAYSKEMREIKFVCTVLLYCYGLKDLNSIPRAHLNAWRRTQMWLTLANEIKNIVLPQSNFSKINKLREPGFKKKAVIRGSPEQFKKKQRSWSQS